MRATRPSSSSVERLVGRVLRAAAHEPPQQLLGLGSAELQRGRVLDQFVIPLLDQLPVDRPTGDHRRDRRPVLVAGESGTVEP